MMYTSQKPEMETRELLLLIKDPARQTELERFLDTNYPSQFRIDCAGNEPEALEKLTASQPHYDLAIIDDGFNRQPAPCCCPELVKKIKSGHKHIPVILISGTRERFQQLSLEARKAGAILCFCSPANYEELAYALQFSSEHSKFHRERKMLEKLHEISVALNSTTDLKEILKLTCKAAVEICSVDHSAVVLFEKNLLKGKVIAEYPPQENFVETEIQVKDIPLEERLVYHQEIINISDLRNYKPLDNVQKKLIGLNIRSVLIVPVVLNGKVIASFSLDMLTRTRIFHRDEIELLKKLANQVATAVDKARHVQELSVINRISYEISSTAPMDLDPGKITALVREHAGSLMDVTNFYISLYDEKTNCYSFPFHADQKDDINCIPSGKLAKGLTDYVRRTRSAVLVDSRKNRELLEKGEIELVGTPSCVWLGAPLIARNNVLGVMAVQNYESENAYDAQDLTVLQTIASQTAVALDNARLFARVQEQKDNQIEAVQQISRTIAASVKQDRMFRGILKWAIPLIGEAHLAEIRLLNRKTRELEVVVSRGVTIKRKYRKVPAERGVIGWVARHKKSALVPDVSDDPRYSPIHEGTGSKIAVPLLKNRELMGVLNIEHLGKNAFNGNELALAEAIADLAVVAIENARLYKDLDQKINALEEANQDIADTQKLLTRASFASKILHRLNNLAGTIPPRINMAMEKLDPSHPGDSEVIKQLRAISHHSDILLQEARKLKEEEQPQPPERLAINQLMELALKKAISFVPDIEKQITIERDFSTDPGTVYARRNELLETLFNIILNALEAMGKSGNLVLYTGRGCLRNKPCVDICISDTGMGIPKKNVSHIFMPYFSTKENGMGYGLWKSRWFIKKLEGNIEVKSQQGKGSSFTIKIPVYPGQTPGTGM